MPPEFQWTMGAAPELDEPPAPNPPPPGPGRSANPRVWRLTILLIVVVLLALGAYAIWNSQKVPRDLRQLIAREETAGRTGDVATLWDIGDPSDWTWRRALLQLAIAQQPAPLPSAALRQAPGSADAISFSILAPDQVRADVTRAYSAPDGATLAFTVPQFYRFTQGAWHHTAPPSEGAAARFWRGHYVSVAGVAADADFVANDLGPFLDDVVQRACAVWTCPRGPFIGVGFAGDFSFTSWPGAAPMPADAPLLFGFIRGANPMLSHSGPNILASAINIQSPHLAGYPADAASATWLRRAIALQTLNALANHIARPDQADRDANAFLLALVVRMGARLGLEAPGALDWHPAAAGAQSPSRELSSNLNLMWDLGQRDNRGQPVLGFRATDGSLFGSEDPGAWDAVLSGALNITNWVLRDQPPETDGRLLHGLASAQDQGAWLSQTLGLSPEAAWARWQVGRWQVNRTAGQPELALDCTYGAGLLAPGQARPVYFLAWQSDSFGQGQGVAYSPDGQWVITESGNAIVAVDVETGSLVRLAPPAASDNLAFRGWMTNSILAYLLQTDTADNLYSVHFFDLADPTRSFASVPDVQDYRLSPDRTRAAVFGPPDPAVPLGLALEVIPAWGGTPTTTDNAPNTDLRPSLLAWSPDSQLLTYGIRDPASGTFSLRVMDPTHSASREVLNSQELNLNGALDGLIAWSPSGQQIAFALRQDDQASDSPAAFGMANADGTGLTLLRRQNGFYTQLGWSADGNYVAAVHYESEGQSTQAGTIGVFDAASKLEINELVNSWGFAWSPQGHQLIDLHNPVELFSEPSGPVSQILSTDACSMVAWKP